MQCTHYPPTSKPDGPGRIALDLVPDVCKYMDYVPPNIINISLTMQSKSFSSCLVLSEKYLLEYLYSITFLYFNSRLPESYENSALKENPSNNFVQFFSFVDTWLVVNRWQALLNPRKKNIAVRRSRPLTWRE